MTSSSRQRLVLAARVLFSERGYARTSVGDIEERAGFTRRGGTLYKHFDDKAAVLDAVVTDQVAEARSRHREASALPAGELGDEVTHLARRLLEELEHERELTALIDREGAAVGDLATTFFQEITEPGFHLSAKLLAERFPGAEWDHDALAVLIVGALVNHRRTRWSFDATPLDVDEERLIAALRHLLVAAGGHAPVTDHPGARRRIPPAVPELDAAAVDRAVRGGLAFFDGDLVVTGAGAVRTLQVAADDAGSTIRRAIAEGAPGALFAASFDPDEPTTILIPERLEVGTVPAGLDERMMVDADPAQVAVSISQSARSWATSVADASATIRNPASPLEKVVAAREVRVRAATDLDPRVVLGRLARMFPTAFLFSIGGLVGASPELLGQVSDGRFRCRALAGTVGRLSDPDRDAATARALLASAKDRHEHRLLREFLVERLGSVVDGLRFNAEPELLTLANVHHLMTVFEGRPHTRCAGPGGLVDLVASVHPTPAVAGVPQAGALEWIRAHEPPRGRLHGFAGWTDREGDGQAVLVLRSLEIDGPSARLVVGNGIVGQSDPEAEVLENQAKTRGILDAVTSL